MVIWVKNKFILKENKIITMKVSIIYSYLYNFTNLSLFSKKKKKNRNTNLVQSISFPIIYLSTYSIYSFIMSIFVYTNNIDYIGKYK